MAPQEFDPPIGVAEMLAPGLRRIVAPNPSAMTYRGTNTYLLGWRDLAVIDPGPDDPAHQAAILRAIGPDQRVVHIVVTHAHRDHSALAARLAAATGAKVLAFGDAKAGRSAAMSDLAARLPELGGEGVDHGFAPDARLGDGDALSGDGWRLKALWTPGHMGNHLSLSWEDTVFSGDIAMGWASTTISPPDGDLADFRASLDRLRGLAPRTLWPGHGAPVTAPRARLDWLGTHRDTREAQILDALSQGSARIDALTAAIYAGTPSALHAAAARNVLAHLIDLLARGRVLAEAGDLPEAVFTLVRPHDEKAAIPSGRC